MSEAGKAFFSNRHLIPFLVVLMSCYQCCWCRPALVALSVIGKPTSQSTRETSGSAVDGSLSTFQHSDPSRDPHPWWKLDLEDAHCIGNIIVSNRIGCCDGDRFIGAVVRAGLSSNYADNRPCGLPATTAQAVPGSVNNFLCDSPRFARYITVDINCSRPGVTNPILQMAEVEVEEYPTAECEFAHTSAYFRGLYEHSLILSPAPISRETTVILTQCSLYCINHAQCLSFAFSPRSSQCHMYNLNSSSIMPTANGDFIIYVTE
ncbi:uncharacterized protein LOC110985832 [Acanthaster planci]|uniref:Uncharacterized protein LOC110985832 n=1 Tax=Acanthaster planci TaxID=133434 RepID=A0A8B7ZB76_ACAPL|nr:uncharacterized protein LOC110985832 [Acanthaster planci]